MDDLNIKNVLFSLIPLILIVLFSWLFSSMGSRAKREGQESSFPSEKSPLETMTLLFGDEEEAEERYLQAHEDDAIDAGEEFGHVDSTNWRSHDDLRAPTVSPDPIKPRWWGA